MILTKPQLSEVCLPFFLLISTKVILTVMVFADSKLKGPMLSPFSFQFIYFIYVAGVSTFVWNCPATNTAMFVTLQHFLLRLSNSTTIVPLTLLLFLTLTASRKSVMLLFVRLTEARH